MFGAQVPGLLLTIPFTMVTAPLSEKSCITSVRFLVLMITSGEPTSTFQSLGLPNLSVENTNISTVIPGVDWVMVCLPSLKVNETGVTDAKSRDGPRGLARVRVAVTLSLPVYGLVKLVKSLPV